jgi:phytoene desaturase
MSDDRWDAIVVGSGLGGLTTAAYLQANGLRTLVLEQYAVAGGSSHVFRRKRMWEFDVGVHYIGDCGPDGLIPTVLRGVGLDGRIEFLPMDPDGFDTVLLPDLEFRVPKGWDRYRDRLVEAFPEERKGLERCVSVMAGVAREMMAGGPPRGPMGMVRFAVRSPNTIRWARRPLSALFDACGLSERSRAVLAAESGDYGAPPSRASILMHSLLMDHYIRDGAYYPRGGGMTLAAGLVDAIGSNGGRVRTQARVERILVERGRAAGVRLAGGEELRAPIVVSNADVKRTLADLVGPDHLSSKTLERVRRYRMSLPLVSVYLGLEMDLRERMPNTNYFVLPSYDVEEGYRACYEGRMPDEPSFYMTSASVKDPQATEIAPPGCSSVEIIAMAPGDHSFWGVGEGPAAGESYRRNPAYRSVKDELAEALVESADRVLPGLRDSIAWQECSTPITHERYTLASDGTSYGLEHSPGQSGAMRPRPRTEVPGLHLVGASTLFGHGIAGVMFGGLACASSVLERDLRSEVAAGTVFGDPSRLTAGGPGWDPLEACRRLSEKPRAAVAGARETAPVAAR